MEIRFGAPVYYQDGQQGPSVARVVVEPRLWEVTKLVTEPVEGVPARKLVDLSLVEGRAPSHFTLRLSREELAQQPDYVEAHYTTPRQFLASARPPGPGDQVPSTQVYGRQPRQAPQPPPSAPIELRGNALVETVDGPFGRLDEVLLGGDTYRLAYLVIREDRTGQRLRVPLEWVAYVDPTLIRLSAERNQLSNQMDVPAGNYLAEQPGGSGSQPR